MPERSLASDEALRTHDHGGAWSSGPNDAGGFCAPVSLDGRRALRASDARMERSLRPGRIALEAAGPLSGGRERPSGTGSADGGAFRQAGSDGRDPGSRFDQPVRPGGYAWWYVDAVSDDGAHALTIIAFVGSVFSPYYAWTDWRDPLNHCAFNVALYGQRTSRWTMTERRRSALARNADTLQIGSTSAAWIGDGLSLDIDERGAPCPRRIRGQVRVRFESHNSRAFALDLAQRHWWRPIAPHARVEVAMDAPSLRWSGAGYCDHNAGDEPLERAFQSWTWSRTTIRPRAAVLYDIERRLGGPLALALTFDRNGVCEEHEAPMLAPLRSTGWRLSRFARSDDGQASVVRAFEDAPFYARSLIRHRLFGENAESIHESLSLRRFASPLVRLMLPFRMPRI
jgi:carotenoid 1,2-hydratase